MANPFRSENSKVCQIIKSDKRDQDVITLTSRVDLLLGANAFEYEEKIKPLLAYPNEVLQILIDRLPGEENIHTKGGIMTTMAWMAEELTTDKVCSPEAIKLLNRSVDLIIQTAKNTESITTFQDVVISLNRFNYPDQHFISKLDNLTQDVWSELTGPDTNVSISAFKLHDTGFESELLEHSLERLHKLGADNREFLTTISMQEPKLVGRLNSRIIYKARKWLNTGS